MVIDSLAKLLKPCSPEEFLAFVWGKTYMHASGGAGKFAHLLPWERLNDILRQHRLDFPRVRLVQDGKTLPASSCLRYVTGKRGRAPLPRLKHAELTGHLRAGATLVLDAVNELHEPLEELAEMLGRFFREHVQINAYAGWHTSPGFDLHWDDHDVFILQVTGRKHWSVYGMTPPRASHGGGEDRDNSDDREPGRKPTHAPLWEATLQDGDLLYMPRGCWHVARPLNEPTLHLTVGVHNRTGLDLLRWLVERMSTTEIFRRDLPRFASGAERGAHVERLRAELLTALEGDLLGRYFAEQDEAAQPRARFSLPWSATAEVLPPGAETDDGADTRARVRLLAPRPLDFRIEDGVVEFSCLNKHWRFAGSALPVLQLLEERRVCTVSELCAVAASEELDRRTVRAFLSELLLHGLVAVSRD